MESSISGFHKRNEKEMKRKNLTFRPDKLWEERTQKQKKKGEKDYKKSIHSLEGKYCETVGDGKEYSGTIGKVVDDGIHKGQLTEIDDCIGETFNETTKKKSVESAVPSMYECARQLKEKVPIKCMSNKLFYYDGRCYQSLVHQIIIN